MIKYCTVVLILILVTLTHSTCYSADSFDEQDIGTAEGRISAIDTFKSTITVKSLMSYPVIAYNDIALLIGPNTKIMRSGSAISIFDITMGSHANVRYVDKDGAAEALSIKIIK